MNDTINIIWHIDDVRSLAHDINVDVTDEQCREVLARADKDHNADIGINWGVLGQHLAEVLGETNGHS